MAIKYKQEDVRGKKIKNKIITSIHFFFHSLVTTNGDSNRSYCNDALLASETACQSSHI